MKMTIMFADLTLADGQWSGQGSVTATDKDGTRTEALDLGQPKPPAQTNQKRRRAPAKAGSAPGGRES